MEAALTAVVHTGWDQLVQEQRAVLDEFWLGADVEVDGDPAIQQAVRFALFHVFQAAARAEGRAIAANGLTGPGYDGHAFWDTESFVLPVLTATAPRAAADALRWRLSTVDLARERAETLRLHGAAFAWRTIRGQECSGYWPAGTAAMHINADIAAAAMRHVRWTGDTKFEREVALPLLVETARLWLSLGYHGHDGQFHIDGVTGPDEYSADVDDNTYTNLMAKANLLCAAQVALRQPAGSSGARGHRPRTRRMGRRGRGDGRVLRPPARYPGAGPQLQPARPVPVPGCVRHRPVPAAAARPLLRPLPPSGVSSRPNLVLALHWCGNQFSAEEKARAFAYYEALTVRDSSLSACTQAIVAAEVGQLELAYDYLREAALMDLHDLENNTRDGLHIASLAGAWLAPGRRVRAACGTTTAGLSFNPQLPEGMTRLAFSVRWQQVRLKVEIGTAEVVYSITDGPDGQVGLLHDGESLTVHVGAPVTRAVKRTEPLTEPPRQPVGREPQRR